MSLWGLAIVIVINFIYVNCQLELILEEIRKKDEKK